MKKRILIPLVFLAIAAMVILVSQHSIQAQAPGAGGPGGPGGAGGARMMMGVSTDAEWAYLSFELDVPNDVLIKCRPIFKEAYTKNQALREKMGTARGDADAMRNLRTESDAIKTTLDTKLKGVMSAEQLTKIAAWEKATRDRMRQAGAATGGNRAGGAQQRRGN